MSAATRFARHHVEMVAGSTAAKLAGFAVVLALAFGAAAFAGSGIDPRPGEPNATKDDAMAMAGEAAGGDAAAEPVRGLGVSDDRLTLELRRRTAVPGRRVDLTFRIADRARRTVREFDVEHTRRMHVIVVRRDMSGFQHLHPTQRADGAWTVPVRLTEAGTYRVFADFSTAGRASTLADDLTVDGTVRSRALPPAARSAEVDGLRVALTERAPRAGREAELGFGVTRGGKPVEVDDYLGAKGHLVALRQGDLAFLHVHPDARRLRFMARFPTAGRYRLFLQFKAEGAVHTAAFTQEVTP